MLPSAVVLSIVIPIWKMAELESHPIQVQASAILRPSSTVDYTLLHNVKVSIFSSV